MTTREKINAALSTVKEPFTVSDLKHHAGTKYRDASNDLIRLRENGLVKSIGTRGRFRYWVRTGSDVTLPTAKAVEPTAYEKLKLELGI